MRISSVLLRGFSLLSIVVLLMVAILLGGCSRFGNLSEGGAELALSPITDNPSGKIFPGSFIWHDLLTPDIVAAGTFYEKLFGWEIEYQEHSAIVRNNGKRIAGILKVESSERNARGIWIPSVSVENVDTVAKQAEVHGGKILNGPVDMGRRGRAVLISDFQGADIVLLTAEGGDPAETEIAIGDWLWDEVWTQDPENTKKFYSAVLGYDEVLPVKDDYDVFMRQGEWKAGIRHLRSDIEDLLWVPVVRVADPVAIVKNVEALGGVVWITPDMAPNAGNTALISDSTGALLLIQRWSPQLSDGSN